MINNKIAKKVLLINPPSEFKTPVLPLGLAYIAAYLLENNINVSVIDAWAENLDFEELEERIYRKKPDIIGIYMLSPYYNKAKSVIEISRRLFPNSMIVVGGCHSSAMPAETLKDIPQLDICVIGEGEITMYELAASFRNKNDLSTISGIAYRNKNNGKIIFTKPREFIKNLDSLPFPALDLFPLQKYKTHPPYGRENPYFTMVTSRGCPFQCAFCSKDVFKNIFRAMSPQKVCNEIEKLISEYGAREIHFYEDDFTLDILRAKEICDEILRRGIKIRWSCCTRVDLINEELLKKMKQAGCWLIAYGVESANQNILNAINKGITINQILAAFEATRRVGLLTIAYLIFGLPGETKETVEETINFVKKIEPDFIACAAALAYPGSHFYKLIRSGKYHGRLRNLDEGGNTAGTFAGKGNLIIFEENFTLEELKEVVKRAHWKFYLRPKYIWQSLKSIRSFSGFKYYLNGAIEVIKSLIG